MGPNDHWRGTTEQSVSPIDSLHRLVISSIPIGFGSSVSSIGCPDQTILPPLSTRNAVGIASDSKLLIDRLRGIDRHVVIHRDLLLKFLHGCLVLVGDSDDLQSLGFVF